MPVEAAFGPEECHDIYMVSFVKRKESSITDFFPFSSIGSLDKVFGATHPDGRLEADEEDDREVRGFLSKPDVLIDSTTDCLNWRFPPETSGMDVDLLG